MLRKMASSQSQASCISGEVSKTQKKVLICLGERKREVTFFSEAGVGDGRELANQAREVYKEVLGSKTFVLQIKK